jgi:uncharacterized protein (DUF2236 family)
MRELHASIVDNGLFNLIGAQPTILMQVADAAGARGLMMHGMGLFEKPVRRFVHTIEFLRAVSVPPLDALQNEGPYSDQLRRVLKYYHSIHKNMQPQIINGQSYGFSGENRFWVWCSIMYSEMPPKNRFTYPWSKNIKQRMYERMVRIGIDFLETPDMYPKLYDDFLTMFDQRLRQLEPTKESLFLTHEMIYPSKGPLLFRMTSRLISPLSKELTHEHIKKRYNLESNILENIAAWFMILVLRLILPFLPQCVVDTDNLLYCMRKLDPKAGTILNFGKRERQ